VAMADLRHQGGDRAISDTATFVSFAVFGALYPGMGIIGMQLATERTQGLLTYKRALPMPAGSYVLAKLLMALVFGVLVIALLIVMATSLGGVRIDAAKLGALVGVMAAGVAPGCAMGLFIAALFPPPAANAVANTAFIAMMNLAGLFFPLPPALEATKSIWPAFHLHQLGLAAIGEPMQGGIFPHLAVLVAMTAGFSVLAAALLKRLK
jgi:ABC-2 type transport system permease protein